MIQRGRFGPVFLDFHRSRIAPAPSAKQVAAASMAMKLAPADSGKGVAEEELSAGRPLEPGDASPTNSSKRKNKQPNPTANRTRSPNRGAFRRNSATMGE